MKKTNIALLLSLTLMMGAPVQALAAEIPDAADEYSDEDFSGDDGDYEDGWDDGEGWNDDDPDDYVDDDTFEYEDEEWDADPYEDTGYDAYFLYGEYDDYEVIGDGDEEDPYGNSGYYDVGWEDTEGSENYGTEIGYEDEDTDVDPENGIEGEDTEITEGDDEEVPGSESADTENGSEAADTENDTEAADAENDTEAADTVNDTEANPENDTEADTEADTEQDIPADADDPEAADGTETAEDFISGSEKDPEETVVYVVTVEAEPGQTANIISYVLPAGTELGREENGFAYNDDEDSSESDNGRGSSRSQGSGLQGKEAEDQAANPEKDWDYEVKDNEVTLKHYKGTAENVIIPSAIQGKPVTRIASGFMKDNTSLTAVTIPEKVVEIEDGAFAGCTKLTKVFFNAECCKKAEGAFRNAGTPGEMLTIVFGKGVKEIPEGMFTGYFAD